MDPLTCMPDPLGSYTTDRTSLERSPDQLQVAGWSPEQLHGREDIARMEPEQLQGVQHVERSPEHHVKNTQAG